MEIPRVRLQIKFGAICRKIKQTLTNMFNPMPYPDPAVRACVENDNWNYFDVGFGRYYLKLRNFYSWQECDIAAQEIGMQFQL